MGTDNTSLHGNDQNSGQILSFDFRLPLEKFLLIVCYRVHLYQISNQARNVSLKNSDSILADAKPTFYELMIACMILIVGCTESGKFTGTNRVINLSHIHTEK